MACCIFTAYMMNRIIKACEVLDLNIIKIQYNDFDHGPTYNTAVSVDEKGSCFVATKLSIKGMTCAACTSAIEVAVAALSGVERVAVSLPLSRATVIHKPSVTSVAEIVSAVEKAGYNVREGDRSAEQNLEIAQHAVELKRLKSGFSNAATLASVIVVMDWSCQLSLLSTYHNNFRIVSAALGTWVQLVEALWIHQRAWALGVRSPLTMNTLISLSLICGLVLSCFNIYLHGIEAANQYFSSGSFLTVVVIGGRYLETLFRRQTSASLAELYRLQSEMAMVSLRKKHSETHKERVPAVLLKPRDEIIIDSGAVIPCDCYVIEGTSIVNQSTMTGESLPATKTAGDFLMSGTRNLSNEIVAIVAREQGESALEQLVSSISIATEESKSKTPSGAPSSHFVSGVLVLAMIGFLWTYAVCDQDLPVSARLNLACERAMAILASACPCALGLATPSAVMTGVSAAWTRGAILVGGFSAIEKMQKLTHIVMDKTGTLTTGRLTVAEVDRKLDTNQLMLLCAAEQQDALTHPVARTVFQWALAQLTDAQKREQNAVEIRELNSEPGKGVSCEARHLPSQDWMPVHVGTSSFLSQRDIFPTGFSELSPPNNATATEVQIAINRNHISTLRLRDTIRPEAPTVICSLKSHFGLTLTLLTGDNEHEANRIAKDSTFPSSLPVPCPTRRKN